MGAPLAAVMTLGDKRLLMQYEEGAEVAVDSPVAEAHQVVELVVAADSPVELVVAADSPVGVAAAEEPQAEVEVVLQAVAVVAEVADRPPFFYWDGD